MAGAPTVRNPYTAGYIDLWIPAAAVSQSDGQSRIRTITCPHDASCSLPSPARSHASIFFRSQLRKLRSR
ncbi:hypothetical protein IEQ34_026680 [Dendrobium chrysotoxum]|uniref:Uncharacterized protein n=1 Tax=Dendrobium chrysotoxum TaxID=161865 RepID=A0AAV7FLQ6_DENCH|nr:hypothetical protein IEQ34_026680 [Dendrobium chrysotoxum]